MATTTYRMLEHDGGRGMSMPAEAHGDSIQPSHEMSHSTTTTNEACWHCLWGHIGPGMFLLWLSIYLFLYAVSLQRPSFIKPCTLDKLRWMSSLIAGPCLAFGEALTHQAWHGANIQHFTVYSIITLDGLIAYHTLVRHVLPISLLGFWEAGTMTCIGYQMSSHFHGGAMITKMHALMFPGLLLCSIFVLLERLLFKPTSSSSSSSSSSSRSSNSSGHIELREALRLGACITMACIGFWFFSIGPAFFAFGNSGFLGQAAATGGGGAAAEDEHETSMSVATLVTADFLVCFTIVAIAWALVVGNRGGEEANGGRRYVELGSNVMMMNMKRRGEEEGDGDTGDDEEEEEEEEDITVHLA